MNPSSKTAPLAVDIFFLDGNWTLHRPKTSESWPAIVPGCVHSDLLRAGTIPSLDWRDNEATQQWIGDESWTYRRSFHLTKAQLAEAKPSLVCEGLDTLATISLNGKEVLRTDNMFLSSTSSST